MSDCIFCKIAEKKISANHVYQDDICIAFHDINPKAPTHFLIIPKTHISSAAHLNNTNSFIVGHIYEVIAKIIQNMDLTDGFRVVTNCGKDGGQTVEHLHFHVLAGRPLTWPPG